MSRFTPRRIVVFYLAFGVFALFLSDVALVWLVNDPAVLTRLQALKGAVEILATASLIYFLTSRNQRSMRQKNSRLRRRQEELTVLHRLLRHNLRNSMNVVSGVATSIPEHTTDEQRRASAETIRSRAKQVVQYSEHASTISDVTMDDGDSNTPQNLSFVVSEVVSDLIHEFPTATFTTDVPSDAPVVASPQLESAVREVGRNAIAHSESSEPLVDFTVEHHRGGWVTLEVSDNGPGIPDMELDALDTGGETPLEHGAGLGLWMVDYVVRSSGGMFEAVGTTDTGSRVRIALPSPSP